MRKIVLIICVVFVLLSIYTFPPSLTVDWDAPIKEIPRDGSPMLLFYRGIVPSDAGILETILKNIYFVMGMGFSIYFIIIFLLAMVEESISEPSNKDLLAVVEKQGDDVYLLKIPSKDVLEKMKRQGL